MKKMFFSLFVLLLTLSLCACGGSSSGGSNTNNATPTPTPTPTPTHYSIQGTVTADGEALANITVDLTGKSSLSTYTDENGSYTFSNLEAGDYTVTPSTASGYTFDSVSLSVTIANENTTGQDFSATRISAAKYLHFSLPDQTNFYTNFPNATVDDEAELLFSGYTLTTDIPYEDDVTVSGYALAQFVDEEVVLAGTPDPEGILGAHDPRVLYSVVAVSNNDGFDNRTKFMGKGYYNPDLRWDQFITGYLLDLDYSAKTYFPGSLTGELVKMYNNKYAFDIYLFRRIDVKKPDAAGTLVSFEVMATDESYVDDANYEAGTTKFIVETVTYKNASDVKAISLDQFITAYVTDSPNAYTFRIVSIDDTFKEGWTYAEMQEAYYLPDWDLVVRIDAAGAEVDGTKLNYPVRIELVGDTVEYDGTANPAPAYPIYNDADNGYTE